MFNISTRFFTIATTLVRLARATETDWCSMAIEAAAPSLALKGCLLSPRFFWAFNAGFRFLEALCEFAVCSTIERSRFTTAANMTDVSPVLNSNQVAGGRCDWVRKRSHSTTDEMTTCRSSCCGCLQALAYQSTFEHSLPPFFCLTHE